MSDRRRRARAALAAACVAAAAGAGTLWWMRARPPERIVLIVIDTLRRDFLSCYGGSTPTPHIDALAARGQVFADVAASFHQTSMSMTSLFTGRTPSIETGDPGRSLRWNGTNWCGMARFADGGGGDADCVPAALPTLAERLQEGGYWTIGIASNQFLFEPSGFSRGFDDWVEVGDRPSGVGPMRRFRQADTRGTRTASEVFEATVAALARRSSDRLFLYVHYMDVHDYGAGRDAYAASVARADAAVGRLLGHLERIGLLRDAAVVLTSDHGERLDERHALPGRPGHFGNPSFQEVLRVPLVVAPARFADPERFRRTQDVFGLVLEIAGLVPSSAGDLEDGELFVGEKRWLTYWRGPWKSTLHRRSGEYHLFDLAADPGERRDVAGEHPQVELEHRRRIDKLSRGLGASDRSRQQLSPLDEERLRVLGYVE